MLSKKEWFYKNQELLECLYNTLIHMSKSYGIKIIENQNSINDFITMMYNESGHYYILPRNLYPEFLL